MNKYQEALMYIYTVTNDSKITNQLSILEPLVDKATPKKPIPLFIPIAYLPYRCPICGTLVNHKKDKFNYCPKCGQAIDRSEEE